MTESLSPRFKAKFQGALTFNAEEDLRAKEGNKRRSKRIGEESLVSEGNQGKKVFEERVGSCPRWLRGQVSRGLPSAAWMDQHDEHQ